MEYDPVSAQVPLSTKAGPIKAALITSEHLPYARCTRNTVTSYFAAAVTVLEDSDLSFEPFCPACLCR